ncbi:MAG: sulfotransferase [Phormidesmis sp.]
MVQTRVTTAKPLNAPQNKERYKPSKASVSSRSLTPSQTVRKLVLSNLSKAWRSLRLYFRKPEYKSKVFCIGFNKTGTTSLGRALKELGYWHSTYTNKAWLDYYKNNKIVKLLEHTAKFDSVDDLPWLKEDMIPVLDKVFPGSKFIYLERDEASWKRSIYNWSYQLKGEYPDLDEKLAEFRAHRAFVLDYFKNRSSDQFIILNISDPEGYAKLAQFLGKPTSRKAFPHYNATLHNKRS